MSLGQELKKARMKKGWKQKELQRRLQEENQVQMSLKHLSQIEGDKVDPRFSLVQHLAGVLQVSLDGFALAPPPRVGRTGAPAVAEDAGLHFRTVLTRALPCGEPLLAELTVCGACDGTTFRLYYLPLHGHVHYECVACGTVHCPGGRCGPAAAIPASD
jgi:transcriptional regulator with XRE-family HTH domain